MERNSSDNNDELHGHAINSMTSAYQHQTRALTVLYNNNPNFNNMYGSGTITNNNQIANYFNARPRTPPLPYVRLDISRQRECFLIELTNLIGG